MNHISNEDATHRFISAHTSEGICGRTLWNYLSVTQRHLAEDGMFLLEDSLIHKDREPTDYSYMVFPFAKMYEGFLKQLFLDLKCITDRDYYSTHFRIGKALSPYLASRLGTRSAYGQVANQYGKALADRLWNTWKEGRNLVFHYFPHNLRSLSRDQAQTVIELIMTTAEEAVRVTSVRPGNRKEPDICFIGEGKREKKYRREKRKKPEEEYEGGVEELKNIAE